MIPILDGVLGIANKLLDFIPDPSKRAELAAKLEDERRQADLQLAQMQADINKIEAGSTNWFVAGWRPAIGWVCATGFAYEFVSRPIINGILKLFGSSVEFPDIPSDVIQKLLYGMLGLASIRMGEKMTGSEANR